MGQLVNFNSPSPIQRSIAKAGSDENRMGNHKPLSGNGLTSSTLSGGLIANTNAHGPVHESVRDNLPMLKSATFCSQELLGKLQPAHQAAEVAQPRQRLRELEACATAAEVQAELNAVLPTSVVGYGRLKNGDTARAIPQRSSSVITMSRARRRVQRGSLPMPPDVRQGIAS